MKTTFLAVLLSALACLNAQAQGKVIFGNDSAYLFVLGATLPADAGLGGGSATVGDTTGAIPMSPLPSGVTPAVALYSGISSASLLLETALPLTGSNWSAPGLMASKEIPLTSGVPGGGIGYFNVIVYDNAYSLPPSYSSPLSSPSYIAESGIFAATLTSPPSGSTQLVDYWPEGNLVINVPEPSAIALAGIGALALGIHRRRR